MDGETDLEKVVNILDAKQKKRGKRQPPTDPPPPPRATAGPYAVGGDGRLYYNKPAADDLFQPVLLANFDARIDAEIVIDDGAEQRRELEISGTLRNGEVLPAVVIPTGKFSGLGWVVERWGATVVLNAGQSIKDHVRCAIQLLSGTPARRNVFEHTGWRRIDGRWLYLFSGGAIGESGIDSGFDVRLPGTLRDYALSLPADPAAAVCAALRVLDVAPPEVATSAFLAPWRAALSEATPVDFSLFLQGPTGTRKTEIAAIIQAHCGPAWCGKHLPAAWSSTANMLERTAFLAKDAPLAVDDFAPNGSATDISRAHQNADRLLRAQGNRAGRGRMNADGSLRPEYFPRGLIVATGEDVPRGQSARGRTLVLEFAPATVDLAVLSELQDAAARGQLAGAFGLFCRWLAPQMDALKARLPGRRVELRNGINAARNSHARHPDTIASLQLAAEVFADFAAAHGVALGSDWLGRIADGLRAAGAVQGQFQIAEEPAARFVRLVHAALASGRCHVKPLDGKKPEVKTDMTAKGWALRTFGSEFNARTEWLEIGPSIGRFDGDNLYLDPESAYATIQDFAAHQGQPIPVGQRTLYKALDNKGFLRTKDPSGTHFTIRLRLPDGSRKRFLHIGWGCVFNGPSGPSGPDNKQQSDNDGENDEETGTTNDFSQDASGPSGPREREQFSSCGTTAKKRDHCENAEWSRKNEHNQLNEKEINNSGTTGTTGTTSTDNPPPVFCLSKDAVDLWEVLQLYRGGERIGVIARKVGGWSSTRAMMAGQELARRGLARIEGDLITPRCDRQ